MRNYLPKILLILLMAGGFGQLSAQNLEAVNVNLTAPQRAQIHRTSAQMRTTCTLDTVGYTSNKATGLRAISVNNSTSASGIGQYFDVPQPITFSGFTFYGWSSSLPVVNVTVSIFAAGLDSLPTGTALATATVAVDSAFGGGQLNVLEKNAVFSSALTVTNPIVIVITNNSANNIAVVCSDYTAVPADGLGEVLSSVNLGGTWYPGTSINVGGSPFDADWLFSPWVTYEIGADFTPSTYCVTGPTTVNFTNASSPVMGNRMYSLAVFLSLERLSYNWDFGDGSATGFAIDTSHAYAAAGTYTVTLHDTMYQWTGLCTHDTSITIGAPPSAGYSQAVAGLTATFTDGSSGAPTAWFWDFGDGNTSTSQNPTHTYASQGTYTVCLTVTSSCGSDSSCTTVNAVSCSGPSVNWTESSNELVATFTDGSTTSGPASYFWDFGDGNTSSVQNPTHTYGAAGTYTVCLIVNDSCGADTTCNPVTITCTAPTAGWTFGGGGFNVVFTSAASGGTTYAWDFGDGGTSTQQDPTHLYATAGTYWVCQYVTNSCDTDTLCDSVSVPLVGLQDAVLDGHVSAFPNPANGQLNIAIRMIQPEDLEVSVANVLGQQVFTRKMNGVLNESVMIDVSNLEGGMYFLKVSGQSGVINQRIVVSH